MTSHDQTHALGDLLARFFAAVSFAPGERPAYATIDDLFVEGGRLIKNSGETPDIATVEQFVAARQPLVDSGALTAFVELEVGGITEAFGNVAHRFSTYTKRGTLSGETTEGRGLIATQFIRTPDGWRISSMAWDDERPGLSMPARYEPDGA